MCLVSDRQSISHSMQPILDGVLLVCDGVLKVRLALSVERHG